MRTTDGQWLGIILGTVLGLFQAAAATFPITTTQSAGAGSLAQAIASANANPGPDIIQFQIPGAGIQTIIADNLPVITDTVTIDGTSQSGYAGKPLIELTDNGAGFNPAALNITAGNCVVRGLAINQFGGSGSAVQITGPGGNVIESCFIGTTAQGLLYHGAPAGGNGVRIINSPNNIVGGRTQGAGNLISGNNLAVSIVGSKATGNLVQGNLMGTDLTGTNALPNSLGVLMDTGASGNLIGGSTLGARNVISANVSGGISVSDSSGNLIQGNYIGTDLSGTLALGNATTNNQGGGVSILSVFDVATNNIIGGGLAGEGNLISGNHYAGVILSGTATSGNAVQGNFIGLDNTGQKPLGNFDDGILLLGAASNLIGGTNSNEGNVISGNGDNGIELAGESGASGTPSSNNTLVGNFIGVTAPAGITLSFAAQARARQIGLEGGGGAGDNMSMRYLLLNGVLANCNGIRVRLGNDNWMGTPDPFTGYNTIASWGTTPAINIMSGRGNSLGGGLFLGDYRNNTPFFWNPNALGPSVSVLSVLPMGGLLDFSAALDYNGPSDSYDVICYAPIVSTYPELDGYFGYRKGWRVIGSNFTTTSPTGLGSLFGTWPQDTTALRITLTAPDGTTTTPSLPALVLPGSVGDATFKLSVLPRLSSTRASFLSPFNSFLQVQPNVGAGFYNLGYGIHYSLPISDFSSGLYRSALQVPTGTVNFQLKDKLSVGVSYRFSYDSGLPSSVTDTNGSCMLSNAPLGNAVVVVEKQAQVVDPNTGATNSFGLQIPMYLTGLPDQVRAVVQAVMEAFKAAQCNCTAWCGIVGGTVNGVQTVIASGGKLGTCPDEAQVTITGPGGVNVTFPPTPLPPRKRQQFSPAADGTWTVTATICGQSKTCTITLP